MYRFLLWFHISCREVVWHTLAALAWGAVLGALAGLRYDLMFGFSEAECATVQTLIVTVCWTYVGLTQPGEIALDKAPHW